MSSSLLLIITIFSVALAIYPEKCMKEPPSQSSAVECCENFQPLDFDKIFRGCEKFFPVDEKDQPQCELFVCMLQNIKVIGTDNKINKTRVKNYLNERFSGEWTPVGVDAANKCFTKMESLKYSCEAQTFSMCFLKTHIRSCPEKRWKNVKECNDNKDYIAECAEEVMNLSIVV